MASLWQKRRRKTRAGIPKSSHVPKGSARFLTCRCEISNRVSLVSALQHAIVHRNPPSTPTNAIITFHLESPPARCSGHTEVHLFPAWKPPPPPCVDPKGCQVPTPSCDSLKPPFVGNWGTKTCRCPVLDMRRSETERAHGFRFVFFVFFSRPTLTSSLLCAHGGRVWFYRLFEVFEAW